MIREMNATKTGDLSRMVAPLKSRYTMGAMTAKKEFKESLGSKGNYCFGGRNKYNKTFSSNNNILDRKKSFEDFNIYDLVKQNIKMPDGLLYRGKYCGRSKLR